MLQQSRMMQSSVLLYGMIWTEHAGFKEKLFYLNQQLGFHNLTKQFFPFAPLAKHYTVIQCGSRDQEILL